MFETLLTGLAIGVCVSAPVGPIGVLCIQRTLNRGRYHGLATGLGATFSDLIYALLVGFSMSFITDLIEEHQMLIQIAGSIIIMLLGLNIFFSNPSTQLKSSSDQKNPNSYLADFVSSFALCISNPLIVFLFIGLFARFNFFTSDQSTSEHFAGMIAILLGAFAWWGTLTYLVSKLRSKFNVRGLWILNKITGSIIILLGIVGLTMALMGDKVIGS